MLCRIDEYAKISTVFILANKMQESLWKFIIIEKYKYTWNTNTDVDVNMISSRHYIPQNKQTVIVIYNIWTM